LTTQVPSDDPEAFLFPSLAGERGPGKFGLSNEFKKIMARAKIVGKELKSQGGSMRISSLSFHSLRHSAATSIYGNAALESIAKRVTGHRSDALKKYVHEDLEVLRKAITLIPRLPKA
jgi:integrase